MCMWVVTLECRISDSDRPGGDDIGGPVQQSSPQPAAVGAAVPAHVWALTMTRQEDWK